MQNLTGACRFCGQIQQIELKEDIVVTEAMADEQAMLQCGCTEAKQEQDRRKKISNAEQNIDDLFGQSESTRNIAEILNVALLQIVDYKLSNVSVERGKIKAKISRTAKGGIKVERTATQKDALES